MKTFLYQFEINHLKKTFRQLKPESISDRFFSSLFKSYPSLEQLLPPDTLSIGMSIMSVMELVIYSFEKDPENQYVLQKDILIPLKNIVKSNEKYGIKKEYYILAGKIFSEAIEEELTTHKEAVQCWKQLINIVVSTMIDLAVEKKSKSFLRIGVFTTKEKLRKMYQRIMS